MGILEKKTEATIYVYIYIYIYIYVFGMYWVCFGIMKNKMANILHLGSPAKFDAAETATIISQCATCHCLETSSLQWVVGSCCTIVLQGLQRGKCWFLNMKAYSPP